MILYPTIKKVRLYNLESDPEEQYDLAGDKTTTSIQQKLFAELLKLQEELGDDLDLTSTFSWAFSRNFFQCLMLGLENHFRMLFKERSNLVCRRFNVDGFKL